MLSSPSSTLPSDLETFHTTTYLSDFRLNEAHIRILKNRGWISCDKKKQRPLNILSNEISIQMLISTLASFTRPWDSHFNIGMNNFTIPSRFLDPHMPMQEMLLVHIFPWTNASKLFLSYIFSLSRWSEVF